MEQRLEIEQENVKRLEDVNQALESLIKVQADEKSDQKEEYERKMSEKDRKLRKYKDEVSRLHKELADLKKTEGVEGDNSTEREKKRLKNRNHDLKKELKDRAEQLRTTESEAAALSSQVAESDKVIRELQAKVDLCEAEAKKVSKLEKENKSLLNSKEQQKKQNDDDKEQMKKKLKKYKEDLSERSNKITSLTKEKESKEKIINLLTAENKELRENLAKSKKAEERSLKPDQGEFDNLQRKGIEQKQEIESLRSKLTKSQASCEELQRQTKELSERNVTLERTNGRLEELMVEVTHVMKKTRTDQTESGKGNEDVEKKKKKRASDSEVDKDTDASKLSDRIELNISTESFDGEKDKEVIKEQVQEKSITENKSSKYSVERPVEKREYRNDNDILVSPRETSEKEKGKPRKRSWDERDRHDSRDRSSSRRQRSPDRRHSDRRRNRVEESGRHKDMKEGNDSFDFKRVKTSDKNERYIRYI